ncbi:MAG: ABC transporter ATP-binding protein [Pseudohongiellaceae bacterium]
MDYIWFDGVDLDVKGGKISALVGESGSGKSLTALAVIGLLSNNLELIQGRIEFDSLNIAELSEREMSSLRGRQISMIFQEPVGSLNPLAPVGVQVAESLEVHGIASGKRAFSKAIELMERVGIPQPEIRAKQLPYELSGGMCQRAMIASALVSKPKLLIADEPTTALDVTVQAQILQLLSELSSDLGLSVLLITHDMGVVAEIADDVSVMYGGRIVERGSVENIFALPHHPYTQMLLQTLPRVDRPRKEELFTISGSVPSPGDQRSGCRFFPRCDRAVDDCKERPVLLPGVDGAACFSPL